MRLINSSNNNNSRVIMMIMLGIKLKVMIIRMYIKQIIKIRII